MPARARAVLPAPWFPAPLSPRPRPRSHLDPGPGSGPDSRSHTGLRTAPPPPGGPRVHRRLGDAQSRAAAADGGHGVHGGLGGVVPAGGLPARACLRHLPAAGAREPGARRPGPGEAGRARGGSGEAERARGPALPGLPPGAERKGSCGVTGGGEATLARGPGCRSETGILKAECRLYAAWLQPMNEVSSTQSRGCAGAAPNPGSRRVGPNPDP